MITVARCLPGQRRNSAPFAQAVPSRREAAASRGIGGDVPGHRADSGGLGGSPLPRPSACVTAHLASRRRKPDRSRWRGLVRQSVTTVRNGGHPHRFLRGHRSSGAMGRPRAAAACRSRPVRRLATGYGRGRGRQEKTAQDADDDGAGRRWRAGQQAGAIIRRRRTEATTPNSANSATLRHAARR